MKKLTTFILFLSLFLTVPNALYAQETLADIQGELESSEQEYENKEEALKNKELEYDELINELSTVAEEKTKTQNLIQETKNDIAIKEVEIADLEQNQIPKMEDKAAVTLQFAQRNSNKQMLLSIVYSSFTSEECGILETIQATNTLLSEINSNLYELISLLDQVEQDKQMLKDSEEYLEMYQVQLKSQGEYLENLKGQISEEINEAESSLEAQQDVIAAAQEKEAVYEEAGCDADDVYGVDCAVEVIPEAPAGFINPLAHGVVTNEFAGWSYYATTPHTGIDIANSTGTGISATSSGKVLYAGPTGDGGGNSVVLLHVMNGQNYISRYCHMNSISVSTGDVVSQGQSVGTLGSSGNVTGAHLHFEMQQGSTYNWGTLENPRNYVSFPEIGVWW